MEPGAYPAGSWDALMYIDDNGHMNAAGMVSPAAYNDNNWHYAVWTFATSGSGALYVDGQNVGSEQGYAGGYAPNYSYFVGTAFTFEESAGNWNWLYFNGGLDEVTISDIPRSGDWVQTEYNNQSSPSTFYTFNPANTASGCSLGHKPLRIAESAVCGSRSRVHSPVIMDTAFGHARHAHVKRSLHRADCSIAAPQPVVITATNQTNGSTIGQPSSQFCHRLNLSH